jgi:hypothetical protein
MKILITILLLSLTGCNSDEMSFIHYRPAEDENGVVIEEYLEKYLIENDDDYFIYEDIVDDEDDTIEYQSPFVPVTFVLDKSRVHDVESGMSIRRANYPIAETGRVTLVLQDWNQNKDEVFHIVVEDEVRILLRGTAPILIGRNGVITIDITEGQLEQIVFTDEPPLEGVASFMSTGPIPITVHLDEQGNVELEQ